MRWMVLLNRKTRHLTFASLRADHAVDPFNNLQRIFWGSTVEEIPVTVEPRTPTQTI